MGQRLEKARLWVRLKKAIGCGSTPGEGDRLWVNVWRREGDRLWVNAWRRRYRLGVKVVGQRLEKAIGCGSRLEKAIGCGSTPGRLEKAIGCRSRLEKAIGWGSTPGEGDRLWVTLGEGDRFGVNALTR